MKKILSVLLFSTAVFTSAMADDIYLDIDFEKNFPKDVTTLDRDENPTKSGLVNVDFSGGTWTRAMVAKDNRAALSSAYCSYDYEVDDWMILPQVNIKDANAVLTWEAFSVHYDFRENYKIMISETGNKPSDFTEVYTVTEEDYYTQGHAISLEAYYGKDIYIAFVHTGKDKFILAIDNIKVGIIDNNYALINTTDVSTTGGEEVTICGYIRNLGSSCFFNPTLIVDGEYYPKYGEDDVIPPVLYETGEDVPFSFVVNTPDEGTVDYTIAITGDNNEVLWHRTDTVYCSAFPRNILVEKFTGTWCNGCPEGTVTMHKFEQRFRNRIIMVEGHCNDLMQDYYYALGLNYFNSNLPSMVYDRRVGFKSQQAQDDGNIYGVMRLPVTAQVVPSVSYTTDGRLAISSVVRFSEEYDNTLDRYRIGYAITENVVNQDNAAYSQSNSCQTVSCREFYYLPSTVPGAIMHYHHVARGTESAFEGVAASLPNEMLMPGVDYIVNDTIDIPSSVIDSRNISVIAVVVYTRNKMALAACEVKTEEIDWTESVDDVMQDAVRYNVAVDNGTVIVGGLEERASVKVITVDGRTLDAAYGTRCLSLNAGNYKGIAIVSVETATGISNEKILIK